MKIKKYFSSIKSKLSKVPKKAYILCVVLCVALLVIIVVAMAYFTTIKKPLSCNDLYESSKKDFLKANKAENFKHIYEEMNKNAMQCSNNKQEDALTSIRYTHLMMTSAYLSGNKDRAIQIASDTSAWLPDNLPRDVNTSSVLKELDDIYEVKEGVQPAAFTIKLNELKK